MKRAFHCALYLPALVFWVPFAVFYRLANMISKEERYMCWNWFNIQAIDEEIYDLQVEREW